MPTAHERAAEGPRTTPPEIEPGDVVTLKTDGRPYVVLGPVWSMPALYLVRNVEGSYATELTVRRCEIATVRRPAPLLVLHDANPPADAAADPADWLDADGIDPADVDADADPLAGLWAGRRVVFGVPDDRGRRVSACGRFVVVEKHDSRTGRRVRGVYFASDRRVAGCVPNNGRFSPEGSFAECAEWCEDRAAEPVAETPPPVVVRIAGCEPPF